MGEKRRLDAKDLIYDIRAGMTDTQMMEKYKLTPRGLLSALRKLINVQAVSPEELFERFPLYEQLTANDMRKIVRSPLSCPIPIYEAEHPQSRGEVRNVTERGVGVKGIAAKVGETKTFVLDAGAFVAVAPITFSGQCRWVRKKSSGDYVGGFEITMISDTCLQHLRKVIQELDQDE
ncbi:MAG: hypothetical protein AB1646_10805 [Thermodesulfobacteriota bacterium]